MIKMFKIEGIKYGWFDFSMNEKSYPISFLMDVKSELDNIFLLEEWNESKNVVLEMESFGDLLIQTFLNYDDIIISLINVSSDNLEYECFRFNYDEFVENYLSEMESYKYVYLNEFVRPYEDEPYIWNTENYLKLKKGRRIKIIERKCKNMKKVYLAGPLFTREEQYQRKFDVSYLREHVEGFEFYSPLEVELSVDDPNITNAESTHDFYYNKDMEAITSADLAIVDLAHDDNGTLVELGIFKGLNKPYIIINSDFRLIETEGLHRNSFVRGIEKEALLVTNCIEDVADFLNEYELNSKN